jgi:predicted transcriptional regulator
LAQELIQRAKEELLHELLQPNNILAIKEAGRFVSEEEVLSRLLQNAVLDKDDLLTKLRQMLVGENSEFYLKTEKTDKERAAEIAEIAERAAEMITEKARDLKMPRKEN